MDANEIVAAISERVKDTANVNVVFGDLVDGGGGVSIIPVASIKVSGGGGGGKGRKGRQQPAEDETEEGKHSGIGMGMSVMARPLGYIEIKGDAARFIPTPDVTKIAVGGMLVVGLLIMTVNKMMRFKAWKRHKMMFAQRGRS